MVVLVIEIVSKGKLSRTISRQKDSNEQEDIRSPTRFIQVSRYPSRDI